MWKSVTAFGFIEEGRGRLGRDWGVQEINPAISNCTS
jgi:hypothetical protein